MPFVEVNIDEINDKLKEVTKLLVNESLTNIFTEINKIRDTIYEQIKGKRMSKTSDIHDAMWDTGFSEVFKEFKIHGRQYDVYKILDSIDDYIYYDIERFVDRDQWEEQGK